jgi:hypothetical protein
MFIARRAHIADPSSTLTNHLLVGIVLNLVPNPTDADQRRALEHLRACVQMAPTCARGWHELGEAYWRDGADDAVHAFEMAVKCQRFACMWVYFAHLNRTSHSLRALSTIIRMQLKKKTIGAQPAINEAQVLAIHKRSISLAEEAVAVDSDDAESYCKLVHSRLIYLQAVQTRSAMPISHCSLPPHS